MYVNITGNSNNKDVYIYQSYRKENGKTSSKIYQKLGKYNDLLEQFSGSHDALMKWAKSEAQKILWNTTIKLARFLFPYLNWLIFLKIKKDVFTQAIFSCRSFVQIYRLIPSAEKFPNATNTLMISMPF